MHWLMGAAGDSALLQRCVDAAASTDAVVLLADAVVLAAHPEFEKLTASTHVYVCAKDWLQLAGPEYIPPAVKLLTWTQILQLVKQHPLQRSWS